MGVRRLCQNCCYCCFFCSCVFKCQRSFCVCMINAYLLTIICPLLMLVLFTTNYGVTLMSLDKMVKDGEVISSTDMGKVLAQFYIVDSFGILLFVLFLCSFIPALFCACFMEYHFLKMKVYFNEIKSLEMITRPICTPFSETQKVYKSLYRLSQQIQDFKSFLPPHLLPDFEPSALTPRPVNMVDKYMNYENYVTRCETEFLTTDDNFSALSDGSLSSGSSPMGNRSNINSDSGDEVTQNFGTPPELSCLSPPSTNNSTGSSTNRPPKLSIPKSPTLGSPVPKSSNNEKFGLKLDSHVGAIVRVKISSFLRLLEVYPQVFLSLHSETISKIEEIVQKNNGSIQSFDEEVVTLVWCGEFFSKKSRRTESLRVQLALHACSTMVEILRFFYHKVVKSFPFLSTIRMSCVIGSFFLSTMGSKYSKRSVLFGSAVECCDIFLELSEFWNIPMIIDASVAKHAFSEFFLRIVDSTELRNKKILRFYQLLGSRKNNDNNNNKDNESSFVGCGEKSDGSCTSSCSTTPVAKNRRRSSVVSNPTSPEVSNTCSSPHSSTSMTSIRKEEVLLLMYDKAYQLFTNGKYSEAISGFSDILDVWQTDRVSLLRKEICEKAVEQHQQLIGDDKPLILSSPPRSHELQQQQQFDEGEDEDEEGEEDEKEQEEEEGEGEGEDFEWIKKEQEEEEEEEEGEGGEEKEEEEEEEEELGIEDIPDAEEVESDEVVSVDSGRNAMTCVVEEFGDDEEEDDGELMDVEDEEDDERFVKTYSLTKRVKKKFEVRLIRVDKRRRFVNLDLKE